MKRVICLLLMVVSIEINAQCWKDIATGRQQTYGIKTDGTLWAWGTNFRGQLGDGTTVSKDFPTQIGVDTNWATLAASTSGPANHMLAIKTDGTLWSWGSNSMGELGNGNHGSGYGFDEHSPIQVGSDSNWKSATVGQEGTVAIKNDGTLWGWGYVGTIFLSGWNYIPAQLGTFNNWKFAHLGGYSHCVAINSLGTYYGGGNNSFGVLGNGLTSGPYTVFQTIGSYSYKNITTSDDYSMGIRLDGKLMGWGRNDVGQLGDGTSVDKTNPIQIGGFNTWKSVSIGRSHSLAIKDDGTLWAWGNNSYGQLGDGTFVNKNIPTQISTSTDWKSVFCGYSHSIALKTDGTLWTWGDNTYGQLGYNLTGLYNWSNIPMMVNCPTIGLVEFASLDNVFSLYPNPTDNLIFIQNKLSHKLDKIIISDITGRILIEEKNEIKEVDVSKLKAGVYFVDFYSEGKKYQQKFFKQ